jgi:Flp pilus assembly protein RcpC/CpaB
MTRLTFTASATPALVIVGAVGVVMGFGAASASNAQGNEKALVVVHIRVYTEAIPELPSLPGARVDIISKQRRGGDRDTKVFRLLENVLVLSIDTPPPSDENPSQRSILTVALQPEDALRLELATQLGQIILARPGQK